jgi:hypothetical protein
MRRSGDYSQLGAFKSFGPSSPIMTSSTGGNYYQHNRISMSNHNSPAHRPRINSHIPRNQTLQRPESNLSRSMNSNINRLS